MKKINEIFYSIQGEGRNAGRAAIFIRFSGCNIHCPFCDTKHAEGQMMSDEDIVQQVKQYPSNLVILTGGEPSLFVTDDFIEKIHALHKLVAIETNGTKALRCKPDFITLSPKFEFTDNASLEVKECDELKVVYNGKNDIGKYRDIKAKYYYLQPCDTGDLNENEKIVSKVIRYCEQHPQWGISLQTQKILNIR